MNDKDIIKTINDIVWWIPNRKLRDKIRDFFESIRAKHDLINFQLDRITPRANIEKIEIMFG